ncbi:MAG TPA: ATP-dependent DNA helicase RecG, partial [Actinomycetales bacterium]
MTSLDATPEMAVRLDRRVGKKTAAAMEKALGLATVGDLLRHYPKRYLMRGDLTDLSKLPMHEHVTVMARIVQVTGRAMANRPGFILQVTVGDGQRTLALTFFHRNRGIHVSREQALTVGRIGLFSGKVGSYQGSLQLVNPMFDLFSADGGDGDGEDELAAVLERPIPIYAAGGGLQSWEIAKATQTLVTGLGPLPEPIPDQVREQQDLMALHSALVGVHAPETMAHAEKARQRLRYEEAFVVQAALLRRRAARARLRAAPRVPRAEGLLDAFDARLPFELTAGQREVGTQIGDDLASTHPMHRLLQGEVGSGKTVVALRAMLTVVDAGAQAVLMAPTEVLATQHHRSITAMLGPLAEGGLLGGSEIGTRVALLTGSQPTAVRRKVLLQIASGEAGIVIGTHALLQPNVTFAELGLVVVDEQHRFGVEQRDLLRAKAPLPPHLLVMTATPIPRTVAMTVFGDLESSTLTELPRGRSPISTHVVTLDNPAWVARAWQRVAEEVAKGHQAFVVCPRIGDDADADADAGGLPDGPDDDLPLYEPGPDGEDERRPTASVVEAVEQLRAEPALAGLRIEVLHGRLPADVRAEVMGAYAAGDIDVLVATTVIEVGVDVPNATVMVVLDADRFGISQLHQLRGRIGRGGHAGLCLLVTETEDEARRTRLR